MTPATTSLPKSHRPLVIKLLLVVALAFAFGFALVPLYDAFCDLTGLNGKTARSGKFGTGGISSTNNISISANASPSRIDLSRTLTVEFTGTVMPGLPWEITPLTSRLDIHPGELHHVLFRVRNRSDKPIVGQAIPSVSPDWLRSISKNSTASVLPSKRWLPVKRLICRLLLSFNLK